MNTNRLDRYAELELVMREYIWVKEAYQKALDLLSAANKQKNDKAKGVAFKAINRLREIKKELDIRALVILCKNPTMILPIN